MPEQNFNRGPGLVGPIFDAAGTGERPFREAVFLTFTFDPRFFETQLLGKIRSTGAAVTVLTDANIFAPDPRSLLAAGIQYTLGVAATHNAFHPKLCVLAGEQRALLGIGSGNLTTPGWHANDELLTIVEADSTRGTPLLVAQVADFLKNLPGVVPMGPAAAAGLQRTAAQLDGLVSRSPGLDTGHHLLTTLSGPILRQLPLEQLDELRLSAPFHDRSGSALSALLKRFRPARVTVLSQPGRAVMNPRALRKEAEANQCELVFVQLDGDDDQSTRYRHGKLIEAVAGGTVVWTLTGSPNITAAALLKGLPDQGNCEVAVLTLNAEPLLPGPLHCVEDEGRLDNAIPASLDPDAATEPGVRLLQASLVPAGMEINLSGPSETDLPVEISRYTAAPEVFEHLAVIPSGHDRTIVQGDFAAGSRVRVLGQVRPLHDPELVVQRLRPSGGQGANRDVTPAEIFASDAVAKQWHEALVTLVTTQHQPGDGGGTPVAEHTAHPGWSTLDEPDHWADYTQDAVARLGMPIFQLASGLDPAALPGAGLSSAAPAWEDQFDDLDPEVYEDDLTAEALVEETDSARTDPPPAVLSSHQRSRLRRFMRDLVQLAPTLQPWERIAAVKLAVLSTTTPMWDSAGTDWWPLTLCDALASLSEPRWPHDSADQAAAVAAVGLHRLRTALPLDGRGHLGQQIREVTSSLRPLLQQARKDLVEANLDMIRGTTLVDRTAEEVLDELSEASDPQARRATLRRLSRLKPDLSFTWSGATELVVEGNTGNPLATIGEILRQEDLTHPIAVRLSSATRWALVAWTDDHLTTIEGRPGNEPVYKTYDISRALFPLQVLSRGARPLSQPPWNRPDEVDLSVLEACGVSNPLDPGERDDIARS